MENANGNTREGPETLDRELASHLGTIFSLLHKHTGHDFRRYKQGTVLRRIRRRIQTIHAASVADYLALLDREPPEGQALLKELLIGVTQFFRDGEAFDLLARQVLPGIVHGRPAEMPIRVWVPGCASGEEVYSLAILLREQLEAAKVQRPVQLFATDLDADLLLEARRGRYAADIAEQVSPERLARFFTREGDAYQTTSGLRETCVFAQHSLIRDPPFSQLDLISCRNVFIYLAADLQKKLIPLFHRALRLGGCLFLGPAEGIAALPDLFETVDQRHRIFRRRETATPAPVELGVPSRAALRASLSLPVVGSKASGKETAHERVGAAFERAVLDEYAPPTAVVNESGDILFKGLVELHGGSVGVKSEGLGQGSEFTIRLPLLELATDRATAPSARRAAGTRRVLVIEDNIDAAESLREVLELGGHAVEIANSGGDGIEKSRAFQPDMILCDIGLPGMDGYEVARRLRAEKSLASAYLVALTGYALPEDLARAKEAGFDEHIAKPASLERIEQLLANAPRRRSPQ
jgi:chemotaxis methyl-accepting protein methylase/ActR/RegA family two-component response regulator